MFLSKLTIDPTSRHFRRDYADIHEMHRTVMSAFPDVEGDVPARQAHGVLWRLEQNDQGFRLYVQSRTQPSWSSLPNYYLTEPHQVRDIATVFDAITGGNKFAFRLVANPTRAVKRDEKQQLERAQAGKRDQPRHVVLHAPQQQVEWLIRQGERCGFVVPAGRNGRPDLAPYPAFRTQGQSQVESRINRIVIDQVRYDGHLIVTDSVQFAKALGEGIGRAKAYGCGLISLAPPKA
ncbi:type I-E CRISPR-associated protein Cas6/Cse3/CasE [Herbidospora sp. RD11066]